MKNKGKLEIPKKIIYEITQNEAELMRLVKIAKEIVLKEDAMLLKELSKH